VNFHGRERSLFGIDQRAVYSAVLVQVGVNASAAGVLVTKNLFDPEDTNSFTINAKRGLGMRVGTGVPRGQDERGADAEDRNEDP
jgi:phosphoenolpyruvate synthase/pyruvate phosphate dikinase